MAWNIGVLVALLLALAGIAWALYRHGATSSDLIHAADDATEERNLTWAQLETERAYHAETETRRQAAEAQIAADRAARAPGSVPGRAPSARELVGRLLWRRPAGGAAPGGEASPPSAPGAGGGAGDDQADC